MIANRFVPPVALCSRLNTHDLAPHDLNRQEVFAGRSQHLTTVFRWTATMSSILTPHLPGKYTPGSMVMTMPDRSTSFWPAATLGASWISSPRHAPWNA